MYTGPYNTFFQRAVKVQIYTKQSKLHKQIQYESSIFLNDTVNNIFSLCEHSLVIVPLTRWQLNQPNECQRSRIQKTKQLAEKLTKKRKTPTISNPNSAKIPLSIIYKDAAYSCKSYPINPGKFSTEFVQKVMRLNTFLGLSLKVDIKHCKTLMWPSARQHYITRPDSLGASCIFVGTQSWSEM